MSKTLSEALARETTFAEALSDTTQGIVLVMDPKGRIAYANRFLAELGGYGSVAELIGLDWFDTFIPERDRALVRELFQQAIQGKPVHGHRNPIVDCHGHEHEIKWSARRLLDDDGGTLGVLSVGLDITEARQAQHQLERQDARLASVIAGTQDGFIFIDGKARITAFNAAAERIFGYTPKEVEGQKLTLLMPEPYRSEHDGYIQRYERTGEPRAIGRIRVVQGKRRDGEVFPIELSVTKIGAEGKTHYAAFIRDISETVKLRQRAADRQRLAAIGSTSAKFAHEVGNPLNGMLMNLQLITRRITRGVPMAELTPLVERVEHEVRRLSGLLDEFRSMSRRQVYLREPVDPQALLQQFVNLHREEYATCGIEVEILCSSALPRVHIDREKITQVLLNLTKNAVEAMSQAGGSLQLRALEDGPHVVIEVSDVGTGIPEGTEIFEPFVTTKREGTGLGLPVARQIVAAHGGELDYRSAPNEGTTFFIRLPIDPPSESSLNLLRVPP